MEKKENKKVVKKAAKRINTAYKKVSKKQAEKLAPEDVVVLEDSGMSLKEFNIFARRNGIAPIKEINELRITTDGTVGLTTEPPHAVLDIQAPTDKEQGKTINLQGTARIVTKMTDYGRQQAKVSKPVQPVVNIVNTMDDKQVLEHLNTEDGKRRITKIIRDSAFNARRIQPLPEDMRRDTLERDTLRGFTKDTLKPEYQTRTARVIAAIRHAANNAWTRIKDWSWTDCLDD